MSDGRIFDIERASTVDGPGIRTTVFFKGCNLDCAWCHNPESKSFKKQMLFYKDRCNGCGKCVSVCKYGGKNCDFCGECTVYCPENARKICGYDVSVSDVMKEIAKDIGYYKKSGGGVTFSGGECLLQKDFLLELLKECKKLGIHTAVDTAGNVPYEWISEISEHTDLFLYDIKAISPDLHKKYTGADNALILENYKKLLAGGAKVFVRVPTVAEVNATEEEFAKIAEFLKKYKPARVELLPYHPLGKNKYRALYGENPKDKFSAPPKERTEALRKKMN